MYLILLTLLLLNTTCPVLANSVDPDQLASEEANWSGSALFVIKYVNFYQKPGSSNLIGWKLEVGAAIYSAWKGLNENVGLQMLLSYQAFEQLGPALFTFIFISTVTIALYFWSIKVLWFWSIISLWFQWNILSGFSAPKRIVLLLFIRKKKDLYLANV